MKHLNRLLVGLFLCVGLLFMVGAGSLPVTASPSATIFFPGQLWTEDGSPVDDGLYAFEFALFESATEGTALWTEHQSGVFVTGGMFATELGRENAFPTEVLAHDALWLAVSVRGPDDTEFTQMSPRQRVTMPGTVSVAATTAGPSCAHDHVGEVWNAAVAWSSGAFKVNNSLNGPAIWGVNTGGGNAIRGDGYGTSMGVYGEADNAPGVVGRSAQKYGIEGYGTSGVKGEAAAAGTGVYGKSVDGAGVYGHSDNQTGVYGEGPLFGLYSNGDVKIDGDLVVTGSKSGYVVDIAQSDDVYSLETGDVVMIVGVGSAILGEIPGIKVRKVTQAATTAVVGIVDRAYQPDGAAPLDEERVAPQGYLSIVTVGAYRGVKVDATFGAVQVGDLLVASSNPGYAMRADSPQPGTVVGKALGELESGVGLVPVLVTLQ